MENNGHVAVFWDYENCRLPSSMSGYDVVAKIRRAVRAFGNITYFKAYLDVALEATNPRSSILHSELQASGVTLAYCPHSGKKDVADKMMLVDMMAYAIDRPAPATIVLISGDRDFSYGISTLRLRGYDVVVIVPPWAHSSVQSQATFVLNWQTDIISNRFGPIKLDWAGLDASCVFPTVGHSRVENMPADRTNRERSGTEVQTCLCCMNYVDQPASIPPQPSLLGCPAPQSVDVTDRANISALTKDTSDANPDRSHGRLTTLSGMEGSSDIGIQKRTDDAVSQHYLRSGDESKLTCVFESQPASPFAAFDGCNVLERVGQRAAESFGQSAVLGVHDIPPKGNTYSYNRVQPDEPGDASEMSKPASPRSMPNLSPAQAGAEFGYQESFLIRRGSTGSMCDSCEPETHQSEALHSPIHHSMKCSEFYGRGGMRDRRQMSVHSPTPMAHHDGFNTSGLRQSPPLPSNLMTSAPALPEAASTLPPESPFFPLVGILEEYSSRGENRVLRSILGERLRREYPGLYARIGAFTFSQYLSMAEGIGCVILGREEIPGREYASLPDR